jgi:flagellin-like hook-associated protein FlgL
MVDVITPDGSAQGTLKIEAETNFTKKVSVSGVLGVSSEINIVGTTLKILRFDMAQPTKVIFCIEMCRFPSDDRSTRDMRFVGAYDSANPRFHDFGYYTSNIATEASWISLLSIKCTTPNAPVVIPGTLTVGASTANTPTKGVIEILSYAAGPPFDYGKIAYWSLHKLGGALDATGPQHYMGLYVEHGVWTNNAYFSSSDIRIKKNLSNVNDGDALNALRKIEPTEYEYVDVTRGTSRVYGFIAQQVQEHFPQAVTIKTETIPDIYSAADYSLASTTTYSASTSSFQSTTQYIYTLNISSGILSSLQLNSTLRLYDAHNTHIDGKITYTDNCSTVQMTVDKVHELKDDPANPGKLFVYGTEVNDFHVLNKDYLFTMNFAATQEIDRQMQSTMARVSVLEDTVLAQQSKLDAQQSTIDAQQSKLDAQQSTIDAILRRIM